VAFVKYEVLTVMIMMITVFLDMMPYIWWIGTNASKGICCLHIQDKSLNISSHAAYSSVMKMEAAGSSETLIPVYKDYGVTSQKIILM
jgi:hypothetical protein